MLREKFSALIALKMWKLNPYSQKSKDPHDFLYLPEEKEPTKEQKEITDFFNILRSKKNPYDLKQKGIRINHITTNYDSVIEYIYTNNNCVNGYGKSHLDCIYRGFTPSKSTIKDNWLTESLFKLNGGLEIYCNPDGTYKIDYEKKDYKNLQEESPLLILPSYEQDYSSPYFIEILQKSKELLTMAKVLIIVGYSLPEEDVLIRFLLKHFALYETDFQDKKIFYINKGESHNKLRKKLKSVFREAINKPSPKRVHTFSGSFNEFVERFNQLWGPDIKNA